MVRERTLAWLAVAIPASGGPDARAQAPGVEAASATVLSGRRGESPLAFVENRGQWDTPARFVARRGPLVARIEGEGLVLGIERPKEAGYRSVVVRLTFERACTEALLEGEGRQGGVSNFFFGKDPARWRSDVPSFDSVLYRGLYEGIDLRVREGDEGSLEYDLLVAPGADPRSVSIRCEGVSRLAAGEDGSLRLETALGPILQTPPNAWEALPGGVRRRVGCTARLLGPDRFGFEVAARDPSLPFAIDPGLVFSTFLGASNNDMATGVALDASDATVVAGSTRSFNFPATPGAYDTTYNGGSPDGGDLFVAKFSPSSGSLVYSTYVGGSVQDHTYALALDGSGAPTLTGTTRSVDFPTTPGAFGTVLSGGAPGNAEDAFVLRLSPSGNSLLFSTYLGGAALDQGWALALDPSGAPTVAGPTYSTNFPTTPGAYDPTFNGVSGYTDVFVTRLAPSGQSLLWSTYVGGAASYDDARALAVDASGAATVAGRTFSPNFPTTPSAYDTTHNGLYDAFVARLSASGSNLLWSTFLGGTVGEEVYGVAVDPSGATTVGGATLSVFDFPTTSGAYDTTFNGTGPLIGPYFGGDAFVARLSPSGQALAWSTFLGGASDDMAYSLRLDSSGAATVAGWTFSTNFPTTPGAYDTIAGGGAFLCDAFLARLSPSGGSLHYSTLLGGAARDLAYAVARGPAGGATTAGVTDSVDFPATPGAFQTIYYGAGTGLLWNGDGFVSRLDLLPQGASAYGSSTPGCSGPLAIGVTSMPQVGNVSFAVTCTDGPASGIGLLGLSAGGLGSPVVLNGLSLWIDPGSFFFLAVPVASNAVGAAILPLPIPAIPGAAGARLFLQFAWVEACAPGGISGSNALALTIQP